MSFLDAVLDLFRGKAVTIPPMDGALRPNTALDDGEVVTAALAPDNLAMLNGSPIYSSHREIRRIPKRPAHPEPLARRGMNGCSGRETIESSKVDRPVRL